MRGRGGVSTLMLSAEVDVVIRQRDESQEAVAEFRCLFLVAPPTRFAPLPVQWKIRPLLLDVDQPPRLQVPHNRPGQIRIDVRAGIDEIQGLMKVLLLTFLRIPPDPCKSRIWIAVVLQKSDIARRPAARR